MTVRADPSVSVPPTETHGGSHAARDVKQWDAIEAIVAEKGHPLRHVLELFPAYVRRYQLKRFLAHYDLFRQIVDLPGDIVELGVYRGVSLLSWAKFAELFFPTDPMRRVWGFDSFAGLQDFSEADGPMVPRTGKVPSGWSAERVRDEVEKLVELLNEDTVLTRNMKRCELVVGDIAETIPQWLEANPGIRISLLHFDIDLYKPTKLGLELLWDRVVRGGVVIFDEYGLVPWEGESNAVDEFFSARKLDVRIRKFPHTGSPAGYLVK